MQTLVVLGIVAVGLFLAVKLKDSEKKVSQEISSNINDIATKPEKVNSAVKLLYMSLITSLFSMLFIISLMIYYFGEDGQLASYIASIVSLSVISILFYGFYFLLIRKIGVGRNWARIIFIVIMILSIPSAAYGFLYWISVNPTTTIGIIFRIASILLGLFHTIIQITALVLLCNKESSIWFKGIKTT